MKLVKKEMIHWMDQKASSDYGIPTILLMEHAAQALCDAFIQLYDRNQKVCVVCGPGNNGGDGFALARLLYQNQYCVSVYCPVLPDKMSQDEFINAKMVEALEIPYYQTFDAFLEVLKQCDVVVDALFGVGLSRDIQGDYADLIKTINQGEKAVVSIDIPSGIDGTTGFKKGHAIIAHHTLTLAAYKQGLFINDARKHCGNIQLLDIQIPSKLMNECEGANVIDESIILSQLPKRMPYSHKGSYGKALMIGGSMAMHGALTLAAKACLQSGIGTFTLMVPDCISSILAMKLEECMLLSAPSKDGYFDELAISLLKEVLPQYDFIVIGNGMGRSDTCRKMVEAVLQSDKPC
ncbi:MAG: NAD(P)H-hydrate epimerase, partial [Longicatena sp.]|nr:NAD(P)H-hydrate epimerase [Longicatena sp.]